MKTIVKYNNRKLYDKQESKYINLKELVSMELGSFKVVEKETGNDITVNTMLSYLSNDSSENSNEYKVKVMKHCIELLSGFVTQEPKEVLKKVVVELKEEQPQESNETEEVFASNFWDTLE